MQGTQLAARGYAVAFYPGATDIASASAVEVAVGQHVEINFDLVSQPFHRISGTVSGYPHNAGINFRMTNAAGQDMGAGLESFDQARGTFRSVWLPGGSYTLTLEAQDPEGGRAYFGSQALNLSSDVSGIHLHLLPSLNIAVNVRLETSRSDSPPAPQYFVTRGPRGMVRRQVNIPARIVLSPQAPTRQQQYFSEPGQEDSSLEIANVPPGVYSAEVFPNGPYYVESARCGTLNLLEQDLTVAPGSAVQPIEVVLRDDFGSLEGSVAIGAGDESMMVIAIPEGGQGQIWNAELARPAGSLDAAHATVVFQIALLAPGTYRVLAVDRPSDFEYRNPEVLQKYVSKAREISVGANQKAKIDLEVVHIGE